MESIQGSLGFEVARDGTVEVSVDGAPLATIGRSDGTDTNRNIPIYMADGNRWMVSTTVPPMLAKALDGDSAPTPSPVSPFGVPVWPSKVESDAGSLASADAGVSPMTFSPVAVTIRSGDAEYSLSAGPSWRSWTLAQGEGALATIETDDGIAARVDHSVPTPVAVLAVAIALGVASGSHRASFMTARRREGKAQDKFLKKYAPDMDSARQAGHNVQYMSSWDQQNDLYSWTECLICGRGASTFGGLGGSMKSAIFFGKAMGDLKGPLLDEPCPGYRTI